MGAQDVIMSRVGDVALIHRRYAPDLFASQIQPPCSPDFELSCGGLIETCAIMTSFVDDLARFGMIQEAVANTFHDSDMMWFLAL